MQMAFQSAVGIADFGYTPGWLRPDAGLPPPKIRMMDHLVAEIVDGRHIARARICVHAGPVPQADAANRGVWSGESPGADSLELPLTRAACPGHDGAVRPQIVAA